MINQLEAAVADNNYNLLSSFYDTVRNPAIKRWNQYKIYKQIALAHWYMVSMNIGIGFDSRLIEKTFPILLNYRIFDDNQTKKL